MAVPQRLGPADVAVLVLHHQPEIQRIEIIRWRGHSSTGAGELRPACAGKRYEGAAECGGRDLVPVYVELIDADRIEKLRYDCKVVWTARRRSACLQPGIARQHRKLG